jgi:hypothetical protein
MQEAVCEWFCCINRCPYIGGTIIDFGDRSSHQKLSLLNWQKQINEPKPHIFEQYRLFEQEIEKFDDMAKFCLGSCENTILRDSNLWSRYTGLQSTG